MIIVDDGYSATAAYSTVSGFAGDYYWVYKKTFTDVEVMNEEEIIEDRKYYYPEYKNKFRDRIVNKRMEISIYKQYRN